MDFDNFTGRMTRDDVIANRVHIISVPCWHLRLVFRLLAMAKRLKMLQESARRAREGLKKSREGEMADNVRSQPFIAPLLPPPSEDLVSDCSSYASYDIRT